MKTLLKTGAMIAASLAMTGCISVVEAGNNDRESYSGVTTAYAPVTKADERMIKAVVYDYFDGQGEASFARLDRAFADNASMFGVAEDDNGNEFVRVWPDMNKVIENWSSNPNPVGARDSDIISMAVTDGRIATVHFRSADRFYDVLTLVKVDGDWEIASKVFVNQ